MSSYIPEPLTDADLVAPEKVDLHLVVGQQVVVLLGDELGAVRRGRRRWHPGQSVGQVVRKHPIHTRGWFVLVNGFTIIAFEDELALVNEKSLAA